MGGHVYKLIELTGASKVSSDDAIRNAIAKASETINNIYWFQVVETRGSIRDGQVSDWQVTLKVGFKLNE